MTDNTNTLPLLPSLTSEPNEFQQLEKQIQQLEKQMEQFKNGARPFDEQIKNLLDQRNAARTETDEKNDEILQQARAAIEANNIAFNELSTKLNEEQNRLRQEKLEFLHNMNKVREELERLERDKLNLIQLLAARERLEKAEREFLELIKDAPFADSILDFQMEDVVFAYDVYKQGMNGVANFNDMGLGKTFETIIFIRAFVQDFYRNNNRLPRIIWLTKKSLIKSSHREIRRWDPDMKAVAFENTGPVDARRMMLEFAIQANAIIITNYEALNGNSILMDTEWDLVVCDEVHKLKGGANPSGPTAIWKNVKRLAHGLDAEHKTQVKSTKPFLNFLSGSPINNHPRDMWAYLHIFNPERFNSLSKFEREFCFAWDQGFIVDFEQLIKVMKKQCIRRRKDEVKIQLPEKTREFRYVDMPGCQREVYNKMRDRFFIELDEMDPTKVLTATVIIAQLTRLRQIAAYPGSIEIKNKDGSITRLDCDRSGKIDEALDIIDELRNEDEQVVVFSSQFNGPLERMSELLNERGISNRMLTGANSSKVDDLCESFRQKEFEVFLINAKSGGEGLNLQKSEAWPGGASHAIFLDLWYNPMFNVQAEDRLHRKGQTDPVTIHILQADDSVDAFIADILEKKENMIAGIVEDESLRPGDWKEKLQGLI